jgi:hypothetical protein
LLVQPLELGSAVLHIVSEAITGVCVRVCVCVRARARAHTHTHIHRGGGGERERERTPKDLLVFLEEWY